MRDAIDERQVREVEIMADEPFEDGFRFQMEKGLWIRLDRARLFASWAK